MSAEDKLRYEISKCRRCEACKDFLDLSCAVFPEMFRLVDKERETGKEITTDQLRYLVNLCTFCAACPCLSIRAAIMNAKAEYVDKYGLDSKIRAIENVERLGKLAGFVPQLTNFLLSNGVSSGLIKGAVGIHRDRKIPNFPIENFTEWFRNRKKNIKQGSKHKKKVAYFAGCTARYFFPEVAKAVVEVFERNDVEVYYPEQKCCAMPSLLEGDRKLTLESVRFNAVRLAAAVEAGYDIVCSCPTCGYMLKKVLKVGADHAAWYRDLEKTDSDFVHIQVGHGLMGDISGMSSLRVQKKHLKQLLKDEGYFSSLIPEKSLLISENTYDVGEYLKILHETGDLDTRMGNIRVRAAYYPPCHLREQKIGRPYQYLMSLLPELSLESINGSYCCGNAGIMGFKQEFHHLSIRIGSRLIAEIKSINPEVLATDCLSCRIQFNQLTSYRVVHPIQIIRESYSKYKEQTEKKAI